VALVPLGRRLPGWRPRSFPRDGHRSRCGWCGGKRWVGDLEVFVPGEFDVGEGQRRGRLVALMAGTTEIDYGTFTITSLCESRVSFRVVWFVDVEHGAGVERPGLE
jgi:hypothetical protein